MPALLVSGVALHLALADADGPAPLFALALALDHVHVHALALLYEGCCPYRDHLGRRSRTPCPAWLIVLAGASSGY